MTQQKNDEPKSDFPVGLGQPALRALNMAGYTRLEQFTTVKEKDLINLHGMGPKAIGMIRSALNKSGLSFASTEPLVPKEKVKENFSDSPKGWVKSHVQEYLKSDGKQGHLWRGMPTLVLTTRGRKSGKLCRTGLIYGQDEENYLIVASNGGSPDHPQWYLNLVKTAEVEIQVGASKFSARARTASSKEKPRLWQVMTKIFPHYDKYQAKAAKAGREIPVVILVLA